MNKFMQIAIKEALKTEADVPVGAVLVKNGEIIAKSDLKDLGMHTELCSDAYLQMYFLGEKSHASVVGSGRFSP